MSETGSPASSKETEVVFYAKVGDMVALKSCEDFEDHYQIENRLMDGSKIRVRKTINRGEITFDFTCKKKTKEQESKSNQECTEFNSRVDEDFFNLFKNIASDMIVKRRYKFKSQKLTLSISGQLEPINIDDMVFEVDLFTRDGVESEYVKIDVEVDKLVAWIEEHYPDVTEARLIISTDKLPFEPYDVIHAPTATEEQKATVQKIWNEQFKTLL